MTIFIFSYELNDLPVVYGKAQVFLLYSGISGRLSVETEDPTFTGLEKHVSRRLVGT